MAEQDGGFGAGFGGVQDCAEVLEVVGDLAEVFDVSGGERGAGALVGAHTASDRQRLGPETPPSPAGQVVPTTEISSDYGGPITSAVAC